MTELETLQRAKMYVDKLSEGISPIDDTAVSKGDYLIKTKIGKDGRAKKERHFTDHQKPWAHSDPHDHVFSWDPKTGQPNF